MTTTSTAVQPAVTSMEIGDKVRLRFAPFGDWGTVTGHCRGKVQVRWGDLELTTKHAPDALVLKFGAEGGNA